MISLKTVSGLVVFSLGMLARTTEASACGGCFVPPEENSQVTGHRMIMSIGATQSTLYDQIEYSGAPESFAWVLPTKGIVEIGVSSDVLFNQLGQDSQVTVAAPPLNCPYNYCNEGVFADGPADADSSASGSGGGVTVIAEKVVGPYETVQLKAEDPAALQTWLADHGYALPKDIEPLVKSYVQEGFNFLAVKLVPGAGVKAMQPIRITSKGSNVTLPLRMVAAGTGALTTISLYVVSEFRAEASNFPRFVVDPKKVLWDYDNNRSNYTELRAEGYKASSGFGWLTESSQAYSSFGLRGQLENILNSLGASASGYGKDGNDADAAQAALQTDMDTLFAGMDPNGVWLTRIRAELPRDALSQDLKLQASSEQTAVDRYIQTTEFIGAQPTCAPVPVDCEYPQGDAVIVVNGGSGCSVGTSRFTDAVFGGVFGLAGLATVLRRRRVAKR